MSHKNSVMILTKTTGDMLSATPRFGTNRIPQFVMISVFRLLHKFQILNSIIRFNSVFMVDNLTGFEKPSQGFLHYESMLAHIPKSGSMRVIWALKKNVSGMMIDPAFPTRVFLKSMVSLHSPIIQGGFL